MTSKTILITGCSTGFGRVTTMRLAKRGWRVFATVRKEADAASLLTEAMAHGFRANVTPLICDITDETQVQDLARAVGEATPTLDALMNNAGSAFAAPLELLPVSELRAQLELNVVAQLRVTQVLLPRLKAVQGLIINVSSVSGKITLPAMGAYSMSKFALEAMSDALRLELAHFGVRVVLIEPGSSLTAIWQTSLQRAEKTMDELAVSVGDYAPLLETVKKSALARAAKGFPPELFAETVEQILNTPKPKARYALPANIRQRILMRRLVSDEWWDKQVRKMIGW